LFFQQSCVADKRLRFSDLKWARLDTLVGAIFTIVVAGCMVIVGNASKVHGIPFAGADGRCFAPIHRQRRSDSNIAPDAECCRAWNDGNLTLECLAYGEVRGWPHSLQLPLRDARGFYSVYFVCVALAAAIVLIPRAPLQMIILSVQVLAGVILPSAIIFLQLLLNDLILLGDEFANKSWNNWINWTIIVVLFALSLVLAAQVITPDLFRQGKLKAI
jgi:Mn2+/Fe2+ NRAMP family transporter